LLVFRFHECRREKDPGWFVVQVGILLTSHPDPKSEPYPYQAIHERVTRKVLEAEKLGFETVWIAEHHFSSTYGTLPDRFSYLVYLGAKTTRIKLGAAVMVVPLHHRMRIVENVTSLDILSNGRFQLGLSYGYPSCELEGLGISYEQRREIQQEAIPLIFKGFHDKRVNANGKHFKFKMDEQYEVFPQSIQKPHPPSYMDAGTNESMQFAAEQGLGLMQDSHPWLRSLASMSSTIVGTCRWPRRPIIQSSFRQCRRGAHGLCRGHPRRAREDSEAGIPHHMKTFLAAGSYLGDLTEKKGEDQFDYDKLAETTILHGSC
jgi:hypothetical protein